MSLVSGIAALAEAVRNKINLMMPRLMPPGGTTGQVLSKTSATDYDVVWDSPVSGVGPTLGQLTAQFMGMGRV